MRIWGGFFNGVWVCGGNNQYLATIRDVVVPGQSSNNACIVIGDDFNGLVQQVYIESCKLAGSQFGIYLRHAEGVNLTSTECLNHVQYGVVTAPGIVGGVRQVEIASVTCLNCQQSAFYLGNAGGTVQIISIVGSSGSGTSGGPGIVIGVNPQDSIISITDCAFVNNAHEGIINLGANGVLISDSMFVGNGWATTNTYDAISIQGGLQNVVKGNFIGPGGGYPAAHRHAIALLDAVDYTVVDLNVTGASGSAPFLNTSTGTHNYVTNPTIGT